MGAYLDFPKKSCKKNCILFASIDPSIDRKAYTLCCNGLVIRKNQKQLKLVTIKKIYILPLLLLLYTINSS